MLSPDELVERNMEWAEAVGLQLESPVIVAYDIDYTMCCLLIPREPLPPLAILATMVCAYPVHWLAHIAGAYLAYYEEFIPEVTPGLLKEEHEAGNDHVHHALTSTLVSTTQQLTSVSALDPDGQWRRLDADLGEQVGEDNVTYTLRRLLELAPQMRKESKVSEDTAKVGLVQLCGEHHCQLITAGDVPMFPFN